jgi:hypothetical protein
MEDEGISYGHLVDFTAIWYFILTFGIFCGNLVCCTKKNLATLTQNRGHLSIFNREMIFFLEGDQ